MTTEVNAESAAPAEGEALPEEVQPVAQDEAEATAAEKQEDSHDDEAEPKKSKGGFQRRIDELTRQREEERREKERLLSLVERLSGNDRPKPQEAQPQGNSEPKREDFDDYEQYLEARAEFRAVKALDARLQQQEAQRAQQAQQTEQQKQVATWNAKLAEARSKLPDFDDVTSSADVAITPQMSSAIMDSDKGAEVAYYLAKNPAEAARIAALSPIGQVREIGKLEDRVQAKPVKPSSAPDPIKPVGARSSGGDPLSDKVPFDQWAKNFEKEFYKGRR
jgi:hypothetical protein